MHKLVIDNIYLLCFPVVSGRPYLSHTSTMRSLGHLCEPLLLMPSLKRRHRKGPQAARPAVAGIAVLCFLTCRTTSLGMYKVPASDVRSGAASLPGICCHRVSCDGGAWHVHVFNYSDTRPQSDRPWAFRPANPDARTPQQPTHTAHSLLNSRLSPLRLHLLIALWGRPVAKGASSVQHSCNVPHRQAARLLINLAPLF